jgi:hypothetical protein
VVCGYAAAACRRISDSTRIADKLQQSRQQKIETDIKLDKQMRKVAELKANFAVEKIYKSRHK